MDHFDRLCLKEHRKRNGRPLNQLWIKILLELDYADDLSTLDESVSKMNEPFEVLWVQGARMGLKINVNNTNH